MGEGEREVCVDSVGGWGGLRNEGRVRVGGRRCAWRGVAKGGAGRVGASAPALAPSAAASERCWPTCVWKTLMSCSSPRRFTSKPLSSANSPLSSNTA